MHIQHCVLGNAGGHGQATWIGAWGTPCLGERACIRRRAAPPGVLVTGQHDGDDQKALHVPSQVVENDGGTFGVMVLLHEVHDDHGVSAEPCPTALGGRILGQGPFLVVAGLD